MGYWLVKSDPDTYGWSSSCGGREDVLGRRAQLQGSQFHSRHEAGDLALFYHSGDEKSVVGAAKVMSEAYPDKTAEEEGWSAVDVAPAWTVKNPVTLSCHQGQPGAREDAPGAGGSSFRDATNDKSIALPSGPGDWCDCSWRSTPPFSSAAAGGRRVVKERAPQDEHEADPHADRECLVQDGHPGQRRHRRVT